MGFLGSIVSSNYFLFLLGAVVILSLGACGEENDGPGGNSSASGFSHNAGQNCNGCHSMKYSGTLYTDASGGRVAGGRKVIITENGGTIIEAVSDNSGNFYVSSGNPSGGYTATVDGNSLPMVASQTNGGCNASGCHDAISTPRVYLN